MPLLEIRVVNLAGPSLPREHGTAGDFTIEIDTGHHRGVEIVRMTPDGFAARKNGQCWAGYFEHHGSCCTNVKAL